MKCYANRVGLRLLNIPGSAPVIAPVDGVPYRLLPDQSDHATDAVQDYRFVSTMNVSGGSGSPTAQVVIQSSVDGVVWYDIAQGATRSAPGVYPEFMDNAALPILPWIRAHLNVAGTTPPSVFVTVDIVATGPFQLSQT